MTGPRGDYLATLSCRSRLDNKRHKISFKIAPPGMGDEIWCFKCNRMSKVIEAPYEYSIDCRDCRYGGHRDMDRYRLYNLADMHARQKRGHRVELRQGRVLLEAWDRAAVGA